MFIKNYNDSKLYIELAKHQYHTKKELYESAQEECERAVMALDEKKLHIWASFSQFVDAYAKIKNLPPRLEGIVGRECIDISIDELDDIKMNANIAVDIIGDLANSAISGAAAGTAVLSAASMIGAVATMGLTWVGLPGGFAAATSMASCWMACYGLSVSPLAVVAVPAMIVGGIFLESSSKKKVEEALKIMEQSRKACLKFDEAEDYIRAINDRCEDICTELTKIHDFYLFKVKALQHIVDEKTDYRQFTKDEQYILASTIILVKLLKNIIILKLIDNKTNNVKSDDPPVNAIKAANEQSPEDVPLFCPSDNITEKIEETKVQRIQLLAKETADLPEQLQFAPLKQEKIVLKKKYIFAPENNVIDANAHLQIVNSEVYIDDTLTICGKAEFHNCNIRIDKELLVSINIDGGNVVFENCHFYATKPAKLAHILCASGKVKFNKSVILNPQYHFNTCSYNRNTLLQCFMHASPQKGKSIIQFLDTEISGGVGRFLVTNAHVKAEFSKCTIANHRGTFARVEDGNNWTNCGMTFINSQFIDCTVHRKTKSHFDKIVYEMKHNSLFDNHHGVLRFKNTTFENISTYLFNLEGLSRTEETTLERCTFKNIRQDKIPLSGSLLTQHSTRRLIAFDQNAVIDNCKFEDCEGLETGAPTSLTYLYQPNIIRNCTFTRYTGDMFLGHIMMESCSFDDSDITIYIEGNNNRHDPYKSVMYDCRFMRCRNKEDIIRCKSYLNQYGICVSVSNCTFEDCSTEYMVDDAIRVGRNKYIDIAEISNIKRIETKKEEETVDYCLKVENSNLISHSLCTIHGTILCGVLKRNQIVTIHKTDGKITTAEICTIFASERLTNEAKAGDTVDIALKVKGKCTIHAGDIIRI